jgi:hypothetical protein
MGYQGNIEGISRDNIGMCTWVLRVPPPWTNPFRFPGWDGLVRDGGGSTVLGFRSQSGTNLVSGSQSWATLACVCLLGSQIET